MVLLTPELENLLPELFALLLAMVFKASIFVFAGFLKASDTILLGFPETRVVRMGVMRLAQMTAPRPL